MSLLKEAGARHEQMIKEAVFGLLAKGMMSTAGGLGKAVVKNPLNSLGYGFDALQMSDGVKGFRQKGLIGKSFMENAAASVPPGSM